MGTQLDLTAEVAHQQTTLAARILAGDGSAEEELVNAYRRGVFLIAVSRTRDADSARDLTQEILIAVLTAVREGKLRDGEKLAAFIQGTARNLINNFLRSRARHPESDIEAAEVLASDPVEDLERAERQRLVRRELESLCPVDKHILLLSLVDGHALAEVAKRLGISHDAVRARKSRAIKKMTAKLRRMSQKPLL